MSRKKKKKNFSVYSLQRNREEFLVAGETWNRRGGRERWKSASGRESGSLAKSTNPIRESLKKVKGSKSSPGLLLRKEKGGKKALEWVEKEKIEPQHGDAR